MNQKTASTETRTCLGLALTVVALIISGCGSPTSPSVPQVQGLWKGFWVQQTCTATGVYTAAGTCQFIQSGLLQLNLTQSGDTVQGTIGLGGLAVVPVSGQIGANGLLTLNGQGTDVSQTNLITISDWHAMVNGASMTNCAFTCTTQLIHSSDSFVETATTSGNIVPGLAN